ncbi:MAG: tol-pal system YbgF family protein [Bacteroidia bacterium]
MEKEIEYQALIDKFLRDEAFSKAEQKDWDSWQQNKAFAELLSYNHDLMLALKQKGREELKQELAGLTELHQKAEGTIRSMRFIWVAVAAAAAICLIWLILPVQQSASPTELYASYYERFPNVANPLTRDSGSQTSLKDRAYAKYEQGGYQQAIMLFDSLMLQEPSLTHQFYQGISAMEQNDWQLARTALEPVRTSDTSRFAKAAQWYIALIALQTDQIEQSKGLLSAIKADSSHPFTKEATAILEGLD